MVSIYKKGAHKLRIPDTTNARATSGLDLIRHLTSTAYRAPNGRFSQQIQQVREAWQSRPFLQASAMEGHFEHE